jgi:hypothetical protein
MSVTGERSYRENLRLNGRWYSRKRDVYLEQLSSSQHGVVRYPEFLQRGVCMSRHWQAMQCDPGFRDLQVGGDHARQARNCEGLCHAKPIISASAAGNVTNQARSRTSETRSRNSISWGPFSR